MLQGVQDQKCQKERATSLEGNTFDPTLVKLKCVWKLYISCVKSYFLKKLEKKKLFCKSNTLLLCLSESWTRDLRHSNPMSYLKIMEAWMKWMSFMVFLYCLYANSCFCRKKCIFLKHILALPMLGQICTVSKLQPFTFDTFDLGHPVLAIILFQCWQSRQCQN